MRRIIILSLALTLVPILKASGQESNALPTGASALQEPMLGTPIPFQEVGARDSRWWISAEYLLWWVKSSPVPTPLVTQGDPANAVAGALGQPGTRILYGGSNESLGVFSGGRFATGLWLDDEQLFGLEASGFFLEHRTQIFSASSTPRGSPMLATPIYDAVNQREGAYLATSPGLATGLTAVHNSSSLWGFEVNFAANLARSANMQADLLVGYRNLQLDEALAAFQVFSPLVNSPPSNFNLGAVLAKKGDTISSFDHFTTRNQFNGGQIGTRFDWTRGRIFTNVTAKLGVGSMHQIVDIDGGSLLVNAKQAQTSAPGGIFALPSNMGSYSRDVFAVVPEVSLNLGVNLSRRLRSFIGYNFLYASNVVRPGNQIDRGVNIHNVPTDSSFGTPGGPARPAFAFQGSDYWAQGINFGLEFRY